MFHLISVGLVSVVVCMPLVATYGRQDADEAFLLQHKTLSQDLADIYMAAASPGDTLQPPAMTRGAKWNKLRQVW